MKFLITLLTRIAAVHHVSYLELITYMSHLPSLINSVTVNLMFILLSLFNFTMGTIFSEGLDYGHKVHASGCEEWDKINRDMED